MARSIRASEQNSVVVGSNPTQILLRPTFYSYFKGSVSGASGDYYTYIYIYIYIYTYVYVYVYMYIYIYIIYISLYRV